MRALRRMPLRAIAARIASLIAFTSSASLATKAMLLACRRHETSALQLHKRVVRQPQLRDANTLTSLPRSRKSRQVLVRYEPRGLPQFPRPLRSPDSVAGCPGSTHRTPCRLPLASTCVRSQPVSHRIRKDLDWAHYSAPRPDCVPVLRATRPATGVAPSLNRTNARAQ